jgi:hypothetical protein
LTLFLPESESANSLYPIWSPPGCRPMSRASTHPSTANRREKSAWVTNDGTPVTLIVHTPAAGGAEGGGWCIIVI